MSNDLVSLDDIIKKKKKTTNSMRTKPINKAAAKNGPKANGAAAAKRPKANKPVEDARFKIIQKKRKFITDARDKLAQIAKQSDARLKLQKLRAINVKKNGDPSTISRKTGRSGRITLSTNKFVPPHVPHTLPPSFIPPSARSLGYRPPPMPEPQYVNEMMMSYNNAKFSKVKEYDYLQQYHPKDYLLDHQALRRTVSNDYAPSLPPPPPLFNIKPVSYNWDKLPQSSLSRSQTIRAVDQSRPRDYKVIPRTAMTKSNSSGTFRDDWSFNSKTRTIIPDVVDKYYSMKNHSRDIGVKSRLDSPPLKASRLAPSTSRPKTVSQTPGYRIVVSNLQPNVTKEDIKELFEDVGELLISRLVRPGIAEVIYKTLKDATKAVETYHNRQLDGHPMKCLLVNPRPKNSSSASSSRILSQSRGGSYAQPSLGTVHRALFDD